MEIKKEYEPFMKEVFRNLPATLFIKDKEGKYAFMDTTGNDSILNFLFDEMYIKVSEGEPSYWMTFRGKEYENYRKWDINTYDR